MYFLGLMKGLTHQAENLMGNGVGHGNEPALAEQSMHLVVEMPCSHTHPCFIQSMGIGTAFITQRVMRHGQHQGGSHASQ
jgi:hypothetical protein